ncbi:hypothetical protein [Parvularcula oceani]|uniref:hypothetical protein n=1 Tax=Parvularcula oceani TaxID=1247963 RepID=UPI0004E1DE35|nr:hypothetical protein [Parvularcula oceani]
MADPKTPGTTPGTQTGPGATGTTTTNTTAGTTGNPTQANYNAEAVRVSDTGTTAHTHKDNSAKKGLIVGILTFLGLALIDWLVGPAASDAESLTFGETIIYAIVGLIVGWVVKLIDKSRQKKTHHA